MHANKTHSNQHNGRLVGRLHRPVDGHHAGAHTCAPCLVQEGMVLHFQIFAPQLQAHVDAVDRDEHLFGGLGFRVKLGLVWGLMVRV